ncbi:MAG: hypothetical protein A2Y40_02875 [Candidatus Margulisbacteria bacterium GWF2_35_9]|nr:MAG: hypothetical protein A2Y40_02875 [Candidatus Margulisbacteria bacterium GWF2_35_9]
MSISIVGSVAFDTLESREGTREKILGGSATYAAIAASNYTAPSMIGVVGKDFPKNYFDILSNRGIDISDLEVKSGNTFHWTGSYLDNINSAQTINTEIGVLDNYHPLINGKNANAKILFLANNDPDVQMEAITKSKSPVIAMDTMNLWINIKKESLIYVINHSHFLFINDGELKMLSGEYNLIKGASWAFKTFKSLKYLILKKGEFGAAIFGRGADEYFTIGAYPLASVKDPTGAGDSFAGSFLGFISDKDFNWQILKEALFIGTITASFTVQEFGPDSLLSANKQDLDIRLSLLKKYSSL